MESDKDNIKALLPQLRFESTQGARLLISMCLVFAAHIVNGQKVDSLTALLQREFGSNRKLILYELAYHYTDVDNVKAMRYVNEAIHRSEVAGDSLMIVKCGRLKSLLYRRLNDIDSSLHLSKKILPIAERNKFSDEIKKILNGLAIVLTFKSSYDEALTTYFRILDLIDLDESKAEASVIFNNIGLVYFKLEDFEKALVYFNKSLSFKNEVKDSFDLDNTLVNISSCYVYLGDYGAAEDFNNQALSACKAGCSKILIARAEFNFGLIFYRRKQFASSEEKIWKSYKLAKEIGDNRHQIDNLILLLQIYIETDDLPSAQRLLTEAEQTLRGRSLYTQGIVDLYARLIKIYQKMGTIDKLAHYQAKYIHLKDSVFSMELTSNLMRVESEYRERENKAMIKSQADILTLREQVIARQKFLNIIAFIVVALAVALVFIMIQNVRRKKRANELLEWKVKERTMELELNHNLLLKSFHERDVQFQRMSTEIKSSLATIKGLGVLVSHDVGAINASSYLAKIEETSNNLIQGLSRVHDQQF